MAVRRNVGHPAEIRHYDELTGELEMQNQRRTQGAVSSMRCDEKGWENAAEFWKKGNRG